MFTLKILSRLWFKLLSSALQKNLYAARVQDEYGSTTNPEGALELLQSTKSVLSSVPPDRLDALLSVLDDGDKMDQVLTELEDAQITPTQVTLQQSLMEKKEKNLQAKRK